MNRNFYRGAESYRETKGIINEYIRIADILPLWNDIRSTSDMNELGEIAGLWLRREVEVLLEKKSKLRRCVAC